jgi:hypothetical protein
MALLAVLSAGPKSNVLIADVAMAKAMQDLWPNGWPQVCRAFLSIEHEADRWNLSKSFKLAYLEHWQHRHELEDGPVEFLGGAEPDEPGFVQQWICTYIVRKNYKVELIAKRKIQPQSVLGSEVLTTEMRQRMDDMLAKIGKGENHEKSSRSSDNTPLLSHVSDSGSCVPKNTKSANLHIVNDCGEKTEVHDSIRNSGGTDRFKPNGCTCFASSQGKPCSCYAGN